MRRHHLILLLDHDSPRLSSLKLLLETHGYRVLASAKPEDALAQLSAHEVEMFITFSHVCAPNSQPIAAYVGENYPRTSVVYRERILSPEDAETPKARFKARELSPAELMEAIRKAFFQRRGPRRTLPSASAARSAS